MRRVIFISIVLQALLCHAQQTLSLTAPAYGSSFRHIKTYQEEAMRLGGTKMQIQTISRSILQAKYGRTGVERLFQGHCPNPSIEGIIKTIRLATSDNPYQAKGYKRTLLYEKEFTRGGEFEVIATDKIIETRFGPTDVDLWLRHRETGENVFVEVKENKLGAQNLEKYKLKVQRLSDYADQRGGRVAFLNRHGFKSEFKEFASKHDVLTYENVATGKLTGQRPGNLPFRHVESDLGLKMEGMATVETTEFTGLQITGTWFRRAGAVGMIAYEGYVIEGYAAGRVSQRELITAQVSLGGALAGAETGAFIGTILVGGPEDPLVAISAPVGALIGGIAGAFGGTKIADGYYGRLDDAQKQVVQNFIYKQYGVIR